MLKELFCPEERYVIEEKPLAKRTWVSILTEHLEYSIHGTIIKDYYCTNNFSSKSEILEPTRRHGEYNSLGEYETINLIFCSKQSAQDCLETNVENPNDFRIVRIKDLDIDD